MKRQSRKVPNITDEINKLKKYFNERLDVFEKGLRHSEEEIKILKESLEKVYIHNKSIVDENRKLKKKI